jgi:hypothetical protein
VAEELKAKEEEASITMALKSMEGIGGDKTYPIKVHHKPVQPLSSPHGAALLCGPPLTHRMPLARRTAEQDSEGEEG